MESTCSSPRPPWEPRKRQNRGQPCKGISISVRVKVWYLCAICAYVFLVQIDALISNPSYLLSCLHFIYSTHTGYIAKHTNKQGVSRLRDALNTYKDISVHKIHYHVQSICATNKQMVHGEGTSFSSGDSYRFGSGAWTNLAQGSL